MPVCKYDEGELRHSKSQKLFNKKKIDKAWLWCLKMPIFEITKIEFYEIDLWFGKKHL